MKLWDHISQLCIWPESELSPHNFVLQQSWTHGEVQSIPGSKRKHQILFDCELYFTCLTIMKVFSIIKPGQLPSFVSVQCRIHPSAIARCSYPHQWLLANTIKRTQEIFPSDKISNHMMRLNPWSYFKDKQLRYSIAIIHYSTYTHIDL